MEETTPRSESLKRVRERLAWLQFEIADIDSQIAEMLNGRAGPCGPDSPAR